MADLNLQEIHDQLVTVAHNAAKLILSAEPTTTDSGTKKNSADLVTETDQAVEKMITETLLTAYPDFQFIGEETYKPGKNGLTDAPTFIVDPIDGTTNFVHGFPSVCISLGFAVKKTPTVGVILNPFTNTLYSAIKGKGAYLRQGDLPPRKLPLRPNPEPFTDLSTCLIGAEWGSDRSGSNFDTKVRVFAKLAAAKDSSHKGAMVHSIRSMGSAALHLCAVAAGFQDLYWEGGCWAWDVCAGWIILTEAGGMMVDGNPGNWEPEVEGRTYLAVRKGEGQKKIVEEFWSVVGDGRLVYEN